MNRNRFLRWAALASALVPAAAAGPAFAQASPAQTNPDADALALQIRVLAQNPRDEQALLAAGELSTRLGDTSAALAFFQRAEAVNPGNPRLFAGRGAALVRLQRPGEALTLFARAEAAGLPIADYAADRGFAFDLLGAPQLAQLDYQLALARRPDDETIRRYALSLGITGKPDEAMAVLDPLLRRSDRAAWRARAFVLAMNGDVAGAERIAASMMPGNMGSALTPFFRRLQALSVADRAFAVHFGELSPTRARIADAQMAPALPAYVAEPRPVAVAQAAPPPAPVQGNRDRRSRRDRDQQVAQAAPVASRPAPEQQAADASLPPPPRYSAPMVQPIPSPASRPVQMAGNDAPRQAAPARPATPQLRAAAEQDYDLDDESVAKTPARPRPQPSAPAPEPSRTVAAPPTTVAESAPPPPREEVGHEDKVLAAIVSGITIPASELGVTPMPGERADSPPAPVAVAAAPPAAKPAPKPAAKAPAKPEAKGKDAAKPDPKAKPDAKGKKAPAKPDPAKAEPSRVWVQVAGGADEKSLPLTWKRLVKQAPAAFKGKSAWTTPLRATNRLLVGPFKNADAAQDFVNILKKADMSGFVFTSEAGQKIAKLPVK